MKSVFPLEFQNYNAKPHCFKGFNHLKWTYFFLLMLLLCLSIALPLLQCKIYSPVEGVLKIGPSEDTGQSVTKNTIPNAIESKNLFANWQLRNEVSNPSPQTDLVVECYVPNVDLESVKRHGEVELRSDFLKTEFGDFSKGHILGIEETQESDSGRRLFKVLCAFNIKRKYFNQYNLTRLVKGIPLTVLFPVDNRSLFHLLFENLEEGFVPVFM